MKKTILTLTLAAAALAFTITPATAEPTLRAYSRFDFEDASFEFIDRYAPPLPLTGLDINTSPQGGVGVVHGEFGSYSFQDHGFYSQDDLGNYETATNHHGGLGVLSTDDLVIDAEGKTGELGYLVSKVRITGKLPNQEYSRTGTAGYFKAGLSVSYGFGGTTGWSSAALITFDTVDGLTSLGVNGSKPTLGGTRMDQVVTSEPTGFYFGQWAGFSMYADVHGDGSPQVPYTDAAATWNFGTAADPVKVEWAGVEVYDNNMNLISVYTAKSTSGYDYSLGQSVPQAPPAVVVTREVDPNEFKLSFRTKSYLNYQLQGSTDLLNWFNIGSQIIGNGLDKEIFDTRSVPKFFWKLKFQN